MTQETLDMNKENYMKSTTAQKDLTNPYNILSILAGYLLRALPF